MLGLYIILKNNINNIEDIPEKITQIVKTNDMIISMGAGSISNITNEIIKKIEDNE